MSAPTLAVRARLRYPQSARVGVAYAVEVRLEHDLPPGQWPGAEEHPIRCFLLCDEAVFAQETVGDGVVVLRRPRGTYGPAVFRLHAVGSGRCDLRVLLVNRSGVTVGVVAAKDVKVS